MRMGEPSDRMKDNTMAKVNNGPQRQPDPCPPHKWGTTGQWVNRCTKCGASKPS